MNEHLDLEKVLKTVQFEKFFLTLQAKLHYYSDLKKNFSSLRFNFNDQFLGLDRRLATQTLLIFFSFKVSMSVWYLTGLLFNLRLFLKPEKLRVVVRSHLNLLWIPLKSFMR